MISENKFELISLPKISEMFDGDTAIVEQVLLGLGHTASEKAIDLKRSYLRKNWSELQSNSRFMGSVYKKVGTPKLNSAIIRLNQLVEEKRHNDELRKIVFELEHLSCAMAREVETYFEVTA